MDNLKPTPKVLTEALTHPINDRLESESMMEPLVLSSGYRHREHLNDLALELAALSIGFRKSIPPAFVRALAVLVRSMNCYYSNLIEGHETHPVDIERALKKDYSSDPSKRNLQLEAEAHIAVQSWIDDGGLSGRALKVESALEVHERFCALLPDELLWVESLETGERIKVVPGGLRSLPPRASAVISLLLVGELPRGDIQSITNSSPATARRVISALSDFGIVVSESSRAPLKLAFPAALASHWLPALFPERKL